MLRVRTNLVCPMVEWLFSSRFTYDNLPVTVVAFITSRGMEIQRIKAHLVEVNIQKLLKHNIGQEHHTEV